MLKIIAAHHPKALRPDAPAPGEQQDRGQRGGNCGGEARSEIVVAEEAVAERLEPVGEGRFVEAVVYC